MVSQIEGLSLPWLIGLFAASAAAVWFGGSRLTRLVDALSRKLALGQAFSGMLLLGGITSLPEAAAVGTSAVTGQAALAVNNLIGSASINLLLLALADAVYGRKALTAVAARPTTLMQGTLCMLLSTAVALLATVGDVALFGGPVGAGAVCLAAGTLAAVWICARFETRHVWEPVGRRGGQEDAAHKGERTSEDDRPLPRLLLHLALAGLLILAAGFTVSVTAENIAERTGLSMGIVGFVLVGAATSLPEASSVVTAVRLRRYQLAIADIFGTNLFNILLLLLADALYRGGPVLAEAGRFEAVGAMLAVSLTGIFLVGLLERKDRTVLRMGYDSLAALVAFALGLVLLASS
jgi:cation:H+ antiporter